MRPKDTGGDLPEILEARARIVEGTLSTIVAVSATVGFLLVVLSPTAKLRQFVLSGSVMAMAWGLRRIVRRTGFRFAAWTFLLTFLGLFSAAAWTAGGLLAPAMGAFFVIVILAGLMLGPRVGHVAAGLVAALAFGFALAHAKGWMPAPWVQHTPWSRAWLVAIYAGLLSVFLGFGMRVLERTLAYAGEEIARRKRTEEELQQARTGLEGMVTERTSELAATVRALERQAGELRGAREAQSRFLALVSHELRTPLTSVRASLGLLAHRGDLPAEAQALADIAVRNTRRLLDLTNELLDLEKVEAGRFEVRREPLDLREPARLAFESLQGLAQVRHLTCELHLPEEPVPVAGDAHRLEQVCLNLLSNAFKHAKGTEPVTLRLERRGAEAWVGVANPGEPIPEVFQERIFHTFHQLEPEAGTSGLGLSLSKAIVEAHGGRIGFESGPERTTFFFLLPRS